MGALGTLDADNEQTLSLIGSDARAIRWLACECARHCVYHTFNKAGEGLVGGYLLEYAGPDARAEALAAGAGADGVAG